VIATRAVNAVVLSWGMRRALIAFAAGAASVLALAPFHLWPILFVTFPVAVLMIDGAAAGRLKGVASAAIVGWWFGLGYFLAGLYWIGNAFLVDAKTFGWLLPFAVAGLPAGLAIFTAIGFALSRLIWTAGAHRVLSFAVGITVAEWLRGHLLSGFPWNAFGYALADSLLLAQSASLVGLWGLTFIALCVGASPVTLLAGSMKDKKALIAPALALALLVIMAGFGAWRLNAFPTSMVANVKLRLMQPNIQQDEKFNYSAKQATMRKYLDLSDRATGPTTAGIRDVTVLIWPESAFPFFLAREADVMAQIADLLPPGTVLITGAVRPPEGPAGQPVRRAYNSIYVIGDDGTILAVYDKNHLVPFGEYLPFQDLMERFGLQQLTKVHGGYIAGNRRRAIALPRAPKVLPLICYEVIFPGEIGSPDDRPGWIVNVTNDAWFGLSPGPYQHLQQARLRAIEEGLPIVRVANSGISAVIDPTGRIVAMIGLGQEGVTDSALPAALRPTLYARAGDIPLLLVIAASALLIMRNRRDRERH
jgi:apolipoprotein N-acyltransferase